LLLKVVILQRMIVKISENIESLLKKGWILKRLFIAL
jgi:hypothetical protein